MGYKARATVKAYTLFEKLAKKSVADMGGITDMVILLRAMIIAGEGREPKGLKDQIEDMGLKELKEAVSPMINFLDELAEDESGTDRPGEDSSQ